MGYWFIECEADEGEVGSSFLSRAMFFSVCLMSHGLPSFELYFPAPL